MSKDEESDCGSRQPVECTSACVGVDTLSEREQQLLHRYFDEEAGLIERKRAESLLARNPAAGEYLAKLDDLRRDLCASMELDAAPVDLWGKVSARIDLEERSAVFLKRGTDYARSSARAGERAGKRTEKKTGWLGKLASPSWAYGFGAGAVTAMAALLVVGPAALSPTGASTGTPTGIDSRSASLPLAINGAEGGALVGGSTRLQATIGSSLPSDLRRISAEQVVAQQPPQFELVDRRSQTGRRQLTAFDIQGTDFDLSPVERRMQTDLFSPRAGVAEVSVNAPQGAVGARGGGPSVSMVAQRATAGALELDWVRSDGRLRMIRDEQAQNPIIFVLRRPVLPNQVGANSSATTASSVRR